MHHLPAPRSARQRRRTLVAALLLPPSAFAQSTPPPDAATLERITVTGSRPTTLPVEIPTTLESVTAAEIARRINATDAEDALKYLPSLTVRKRFIGDWDHAVLATRASGTGNSARSLVYADGILLSNLLGNGAAFTPRWSLVTPEEIERVDVLYGPFSAAYAGNSAGAIVDFTTRLPDRFEAHAKLQGSLQTYRLFRTDDRYGSGAASASVGSRSGVFAWWVDASRQVANSQPVSFVFKNVPAATGGAGTPVTGAVSDRSPRDVPGEILGTTQQAHTVQDHAKLKFAWDVLPTLRASYTLGWWRNTADRDVDSYLRDASGATVTSGPLPRAVVVDGRAYTVLPSDFATQRTRQEHVAHGLALKSATGGRFDVQATASLYTYAHDELRSQLPSPAAPDGGRITDQHGTGWNTLAVKGIWRPDGATANDSAHVVEFGLQRDAFELQTRVVNAAEWTGGEPGTRVSAFAGRTSLASAWAQDAWRFAPAWRAVLGARVEHWRASDGSLADATSTVAFDARAETHVSPKLAADWQVAPSWRLSASAGRAVRMPTVSELYQGTLVAGAVVNNDPNLKPERSWTEEFSVERSFDAATLRATAFHETTHDALYSQVNTTAGGTVATIQNVDRIGTRGVELAGNVASLAALGLRGWSVDGSVTYADSRTTRNDAFPASVGRQQPRVPRWRATVLASYAPSDAWSASLGVRYSGRQYGSLDNGDPNGHAWTGFSDYLVADLRWRWRFAERWTAAAGIDNVNADRYWAFHPYPQRTWHAELRYDL